MNIRRRQRNEALKYLWCESKGRERERAKICDFDMKLDVGERIYAMHWSEQGESRKKTFQIKNAVKEQMKTLRHIYRFPYQSWLHHEK